MSKGRHCHWDYVSATYQNRLFCSGAFVFFVSQHKDGNLYSNDQDYLLEENDDDGLEGTIITSWKHLSVKMTSPILHLYSNKQDC